ncbi:MAG TPA: hypothetical protein VF432_11715 [Thermoanaerobaculia bacterium]
MTLRYTLSRKSSRGAQIGCTFALAVLLGGIGVPLLRTAYTDSGTENNFVVYVVGGGFTLVALLLLYEAIHQLFALRTPETVVEIDTEELVRGAEIQLYFRQPGPAAFESLRANLVGEESWWTGSGKQRRHHVQQLGVFNLFDSGAFEVDARAPYERLVTVRVPDLPRASDRAHGVMWQLEVWGKVRGRADFQHVYPIRVRD